MFYLIKTVEPLVAILDNKSILMVNQCFVLISATLSPLTPQRPEQYRNGQILIHQSSTNYTNSDHQQALRGCHIIIISPVSE